MKDMKLKHGDIIPGLFFQGHGGTESNRIRWSIAVPAQEGFEWLYLDAQGLKMLAIAQVTAHQHEFSVVGRRIFQQFMLPCAMEGWITPDIFVCRRSSDAVIYADPCVLDHFKKVLADAATLWLHFRRPTDDTFNTSEVLAFLMQCAQSDQHKLTILITLAQQGRSQDVWDYLSTLT